MPTLRQLICQIEWADTAAAFQEYGTVYGDGLVETYIAVPNIPQPFTISVMSRGYIAEGLAVLIYIDGEYQCNRNRLGLKPPRRGQSRDESEIVFRLRQKEKAIGDGTFIGRDWRFDSHNMIFMAEVPPDSDHSHFDQLGTIEVIVLRCRAKSLSDEERSTSASYTDGSVLNNTTDGGSHEKFGESPEVGDRRAKVEDAPEEDSAMPFGGLFDGAADEPHLVGLDREAPPSGYWSWTYHPQAAPPQRSQRHVHFDYGPQPAQVCPRVPTDQPQSSQPRSIPGARPPIYSQEDWQNVSSRGPPPHPNWNTVPPPNFSPAVNSGYDATGAYNQAPGLVSEPESQYRGQAGRQVSMQPPPVPGFAAWVPPGHSGPAYQDWTPHLPFGPWALQGVPPDGPSPYPPPPMPTPSFYPYNHNPMQGPGFASKCPTPAGGWGDGSQGNAWEKQGSQDPAKEENNQGDEAGNADNNNWGDSDNANNGEARNSAQGDNGWGNSWDGNNNDNEDWAKGADQSQLGDNNKSNGQNNDNQNSQHAQDWGGDGQTNQQGGILDTGTQNNQQGAPGWDGNKNNTNNNTTQNPFPAPGNWGTGPANAFTDTNALQVQSGQAPFQPRARKSRPLYGPHGAYYSVQTSASLGRVAEVEEEPPYDVPESVATQLGTTHQVQLGKGFMYVHSKATPQYIDYLEEPYARFIFKYRTKGQIERQLGIQIESEPTGDEGKRAFSGMSKDEIIEMLLRAQNALGGKIPSPPPKPAAEENIGRSGSLNPVAVAAPAYPYLKYDLPILRNISNAANAGLGISNANTGPSANPGWANSLSTEMQGLALGQRQHTGNWDAGAGGGGGGQQWNPLQPTVGRDKWGNQPQDQPQMPGANLGWQQEPGNGTQNQQGKNDGWNESGSSSPSLQVPAGWNQGSTKTGGGNGDAASVGGLEGFQPASGTW